ncbi:MAG: dUTP diphosphatase [Candidatus Cloacimonadota bacterium]
MKLVYRTLRSSATAPRRMSLHAAGYDLTADLDEALILAPGAFRAIPTGIAIQLPEGFEAQIRPRSGLALKHGVTVLNSPGTIDADYRGEIMAILINHGSQEFVVQPGMRICQMVINQLPAVELSEVEILEDSMRSDGGFGSTGTS